jgi:hypothetical protein
VPFTLSHAAAALPFRRARLVPSALVIGTFAPDLEYFIRLKAGGGWGHTLPGAFGMSLPLALIALWLFHRLVKVPLVHLFPDGVRARLTDQLVTFSFGPPRRFVLIIVSILVGVATHILWDSCTHGEYWIVRHSPFLNRVWHVPVIGGMFYFVVLQFISSAAGLLILAAWCVHWYRRAMPDARVAANPFSPAHRLVIIVLGVAAAAFGAFMRAYLDVGIPANRDGTGKFMDQIIVTFAALLWWQLAMWGIFGPFRYRKTGAPPQAKPTPRPEFPQSTAPLRSKLAPREMSSRGAAEDLP